MLQAYRGLGDMTISELTKIIPSSPGPDALAAHFVLLPPQRNFQFDPCVHATKALAYARLNARASSSLRRGHTHSHERHSHSTRLSLPFASAVDTISAGALRKGVRFLVIHSSLSADIRRSIFRTIFVGRFPSSCNRIMAIQFFLLERNDNSRPLVFATAFSTSSVHSAR
jgi:hypothetical protein